MESLFSVLKEYKAWDSGIENNCGRIILFFFLRFIFGLFEPLLTEQ